MRRVIVFDGGWGGENVANYLSEELSIIEVIRIIDWANAPYQNKTLAEICQLCERALVTFIGEVDVIVLGGYVVSMALDYLRKRYPYQKFVGARLDREHFTKPRIRPSQVMILMNDMLYQGELHQTICQHFNQSIVFTPRCANLEAMCDVGENSLENLRQELTEDGISPDLVILLNTHFWDLKPKLTELWTWRTQVIDFRKRLLRDVCTALKLRGIDGGRPL